MSKGYRVIQISILCYSIEFEQEFTGSIPLYKAAILKHFPSVLEGTNTFNRINLLFDQAPSYDAIIKAIESIAFTKASHPVPVKIWEVPICFDTSFTNDLATVYKGDDQKIEAYRDHFLATTFTLEFYGFMPGFGYLSGLPKALHLPRKNNPSATLQGSVSVGGAQVGVYPQDSPGGWQCLGNCPINWINFIKEPYVFIAIGDKVRFVAIDLNTHQKIRSEITMGQYQPKHTLR